MNRIASRSWVLILLVLLLVAGLVFFVYEFALEAEKWVLFQGSPHIYEGDNVGRGVVTDRTGILLLDMRQGRIYSDSDPLRMSTVHWLGDRYGSINAPAISHYVSQMAGYNAFNGVYTYGQNGGIAEMTLYSQVQTAALAAMGDYKGTVAVYNYKTGEILCAVTTPSYDPDNVPDISLDTAGSYEGIYVNRFIQSAYTPGSIYKIVTLAAALECIEDIENQRFVCAGSYTIGSDTITCEGAHWEQDLKTAFCNSCNCAFAQIAEQLGSENLNRYVAQFGIIKPLSFDGITTGEGNFDLSKAYGIDVAWSAIGQYTDLVNPCRFMTFLGAIAAGGQGVEPHLINKITVDGVTTYSASSVSADRIMSVQTAKILQQYLRNNVQSKYGDDNFQGLTVCAKTGTGEVGGDKKPNALLTGFVADESYPLAFICVVEDGGYGRTVCMPIVSKVLAVCKDAMDSQ